MFKKSLIVFFAVFFSAAGFCEENKITWLESSFPPFTIHNGKYKNQGVVDKIILILQSELKEYNHEKVIGNPERISNELNKGNHVCSVAFIKTNERQKYMYFSSSPTVFGISHVITVLKKNRKKFRYNKELSLKKIIKNRKFCLGIAKGRSYGSAIDYMIKKNMKHGNIYVRHGSDIYEGLMKMLNYGRVDYIIGFPAEMFFIARKLGLEDRMINIPLAESGNIMYGYLVVPKTPWGKKLILRVNEILREKRPKKEYREALEFWVDKNMLKYFKAAYNNQFLNH